VPFETPGAVERAQRVAAVAAMIYLVFNAGYSATGEAIELRASLCDEAIRIARLLLRLFPGEPEILGLTALLLLQHSRTPARFDAQGNLVLLDDQDRSLWNRKMIDEGVALLDKALRHAQPGPYQVQAAIAALHTKANTPQETDWKQIDLLYASLEHLQPSPVVSLNRAVAAWKVRGAQAGLTMIEPLSGELGGYFYFYGVKGAFLMELERLDEAREAFNKAISLANSASEAAHIRQQLDKLARVSTP
jgi:RNA polymerase sigma-70 factor (ECF subfamily)